MKIQADTVVANETKHVVEGEEKICNKQAEEANALKESCEQGLAKAIPALERSGVRCYFGDDVIRYIILVVLIRYIIIIPALESAVKALKTLSKNDIVEVKAMKKPPPGVKLTMEAVCLMMKVMSCHVMSCHVFCPLYIIRPLYVILVR